MRIKVAFLNKNEGISGNSNQAIKIANGDYISLLDHDDMLTPNAFFEVVNAVNENGGVFVVEVGLKVKLHRMALEAPHIFKAVLLEYGGEVGFGHVIGKGAVAEDDRAFADGVLSFVPRSDAKGERLDLFGSDAFGQAHKQRASADVVDFLAGDGAAFRWAR